MGTAHRPSSGKAVRKDRAPVAADSIHGTDSNPAGSDWGTEMGMGWRRRTRIGYRHYQVEEAWEAAEEELGGSAAFGAQSCCSPCFPFFVFLFQVLLREKGWWLPFKVTPQNPESRERERERKEYIQNQGRVQSGIGWTGIGIGDSGSRKVSG